MTRAAMPKGSHVRWEFSMYIGTLERTYCGLGTVEGPCQVIGHKGLSIAVTESETHVAGSRVEAFAHRCEPWPISLPLHEKPGEIVGDSHPSQREITPETGAQKETQSPNKNPVEACQHCLF